jgi:hypothetical protein
MPKWDQKAINAADFDNLPIELAQASCWTGHVCQIPDETDKAHSIKHKKSRVYVAKSAELRGASHVYIIEYTSLAW